MSAGRFRFLGKLFDLGAVQSWWDHNFRQAEKDIQNLETGTTGGAVLLAGRSGGQQVAGGTAGSEDLTLTSNATGTKDRVFFGSAHGSSYDELNNRLSVGAGASPPVGLLVTGNEANNTPGAAVAAALRIINTNQGTVDRVAELQLGTATSAPYAAISGFLKNGTNNTRGDVGFSLRAISTDANLTERLRLDSATGDVKVLSGDLTLETAGKGLKVKEGANARMGVGVMAAGVLVVANTSVTANTRIFAFSNAAGVVGALANTARVVGTSFTITSGVGADAGNVAWLLIEPS